MTSKVEISFPYRLEYGTEKMTDSVTFAHACVANEKLLKTALEILMSHHKNLSMDHFEIVSRKANQSSPLSIYIKLKLIISYNGNNKLSKPESQFEESVRNNKISKKKLKSLLYRIIFHLAIHGVYIVSQDYLELDKPTTEIVEVDESTTITEIISKPEIIDIDINVSGDDNYFDIDVPKVVEEHYESSQREKSAESAKDFMKPSTEANAPITSEDYIVEGKSIRRAPKKENPAKSPPLKKTPIIPMEIPYDRELIIKNAEMGKDGVITVHGINSNGKKITRKYRLQERQN